MKIDFFWDVYILLDDIKRILTSKTTEQWKLYVYEVPPALVAELMDSGLEWGVLCGKNFFHAT